MITEGFEQPRWSNLVGRCVTPRLLLDGENRQNLGLSMDGRITIRGLANMAEPRESDTVDITYADGPQEEAGPLRRVDIDTEMGYMYRGEVLYCAPRELAA